MAYSIFGSTPLLTAADLQALQNNNPFQTQAQAIAANQAASKPKPKPKAATKAATKPKTSTKPKKTIVTFDSVIFHDEGKQQILEALEQINQATLIFDTWGFGETIEKGRGVSMLFDGEPGTGKTMMAQAVANKLNKELKIIAVADVESNVPGEAERNIRKFFKLATDKKHVLLFDECDSLIYSRRGVGPIMAAQVNELLTQLERFDGVTIFTTNRLGNLDEAVNRRLALKLHFPMPDASQRAQIWKRMFPSRAPLHEDIDFGKLSKIELTGGYIKNAVLRAARMAAAEKVRNTKKKITMSHLIKAVKYEAQSMLAFENARHEHIREAYNFMGNVDLGESPTGHTIERHATQELGNGL